MLIDVQEFINERKVSSFQMLVLTLCFLVVLVDGFDAASVGFIAPALVADFKIARSQLGPLFGAGLFGLTLGAFAFGPLADKIGRKYALVLATAFFGVASLLSATAPSLDALTIWRFVTGLGLGGATPIAITLTNEYCPERKRFVLVLTMLCGATLGGVFGGLSTAALVADFGWQGVLVLGGLLPLVFAAALVLFAPESARYLVMKGGQDAKVTGILRRVDPSAQLDGSTFVGAQRPSGSQVGQLFQSGLVRGTVLLWTTFFMSLLVYYLLTSWLPTLLNSAGYGVAPSSLIALMLPVGSTLGAVCLGFLMDRFNPHVVLCFSYALAAAFILMLGFSTGSVVLLIVAAFGTGIGTGGSQIGIYGLAAAFYPTASRATGVGWATTVGRIGSVAGSMIGGQLLALDWGLRGVFALAAIPALLASVAVLAKGFAGPQAIASERPQLSI